MSGAADAKSSTNDSLQSAAVLSLDQSSSVSPSSSSSSSLSSSSSSSSSSSPSSSSSSSSSFSSSSSSSSFSSSSSSGEVEPDGAVLVGGADDFLVDYERRVGQRLARQGQLGGERRAGCGRALDDFDPDDRIVTVAGLVLLLALDDLAALAVDHDFSLADGRVVRVDELELVDRRLDLDGGQRVVPGADERFVSGRERLVVSSASSYETFISAAARAASSASAWSFANPDTLASAFPPDPPVAATAPANNPATSMTATAIASSFGVSGIVLGDNRDRAGKGGWRSRCLADCCGPFHRRFGPLLPSFAPFNLGRSRRVVPRGRN
ncbi:MAG: hypothetical protein BRD21_02590 [Halobacteriales archaeon SW_8_66_22]|nr:MAG: hypothetical protein BRD21_02590 [Halobacteriales archaeon SW_8_66_22]